MKKVGRVVLEALLVTAVGVALAFAANRKLPVPVDLSRNYFPPVPTSQTGPVIVERTPKQLVEDAGFIPVEYEDVLRVFQEKATYDPGVNLIIDAREEAHYKEGHIPMAWRIDHANPKATMLADPLKLLLISAEKVIVYCDGGKCEDSRFVAQDIKDCTELSGAGFDARKIHIYYRGLADWAANKQPIEKGERGSGQISTGGAQ
jgi:rhodanese-related sulfurtransferase